MSTTIKRVWYKIPVRQNISEIKRVVETLFKYGYVFHPDLRIKDYLTLCRRYSPDGNQCEWEYIKIGHDPECNHVMFYLCYWEYQSTKDDYKTVSLKEFLEINGYVKPKEEKKLIITLEEFDKEFERQRNTEIKKRLEKMYDDMDVEELLDRCA